MFGRTLEFQEIVAALERDGAVGVLLAGPMGTGKSSLLDASAEWAAASGSDVVRLHANRATSDIPLLVFSGIATDVREQGERYLAIRDELRARRAADRRLLLAVDDAHELDDASAALVAQLVREGTATLIASVRTGEPTPEPIAALWAQGVAQRMEIGGLGRDDAAALAAEVLGGPLDPVLEAEVWNRTSGNPLFVRELALGSRAAGVLAEVDGLWTRRGELVATDALVGLVQLRIAQLTTDEQLALCAVALAEPAGVALVEQVAGDDALVGLEEAGLVRIRQEHRRLEVRLAHPVYGEAVRSMVSQLRVRRLRLALAAAVQQEGARRSDDLIQVAHWRLDAGDPDPDLFATAAFEAIRRHDFHLAVGLAEAAHEILANGPATRAVAMTRHLVGRHDDAVAALRAALDDPAVDAVEAARMHLLAGLVLARGLGDYAGADQSLRSVGEGATVRVRKRTDAMLALIPLLRGEAAAGLEAAEQLLGDEPEPEAITAYVGALAIAGSPGRAGLEADAWVALHGEPDPRSLFPDFRWVALIDAGRVVQMEREVQEAWDRALDDGDRHRQARLAFAMGHARAERGQLADAVRWFDRSAALSRVIGERFGIRWARCGQLLAAGQSGDLAVADAAIAELDRVPGHPAELFEIYGHRGRAFLDAARGCAEEASVSLLALADRLLAAGTITHAVRTLVDAARLGAAPAAHETIEAAHLQVDGELMPRLVALVRAMAEGDAAAAGEIAATLDALGHTMLGIAAACACRDLHHAAGRPHDAETWDRYARRVGQVVGAADPASGPSTDAGALLTRREREVATLVSRGMTSRQVADACFLSVRTVDNHLARIYDKLGVRSRTELAGALGSLFIGAAT